MQTKFDPDTIGMLLSDVSRLLRGAFDRSINASALGITPGEARTLIQISAYGRSKQADIAVRMGIEPMTLSAYLDRLEALGLVERVPDACDRRAKNVVVTEKADPLLADIKAEMRILMGDVTAGLDLEEREDLRAKLIILRQNLRQPDRSSNPGEKGENS
ncbi:MarR family transcriptional regulator [Sinorhizobium sp. BG8]|uniref:MarR family winged helix-turn-helix transcriptional regulator n=1 Tax=Sinorhizobium sp. BG8 TaxID=2613773 RepID=UPI00193E7CB9|nr:MarR family transcriptional regulator [Sinorhizobium sp. BG8]QRM53472.1 MarR family transcriptional regulator [Sinorhizobium sp. BG8]